MRITPGPTSHDVRIDDPVARSVVRAHDEAARGLGVLAGTPVGEVGCEVAAPGVEALVAALGATASDLGRVNRHLADGVGLAVRDLGGSDDAVATRFRSAAREGR